MYDQAEIDRKFARNLPLYVEGLRTTDYSDLFLNGSSIRNRGLMAFADALFECGYGYVYERSSFRDRETRPAFIMA